MNLVWPSREHLPGYVDALKRGWSPDNVRGEEAAREQLDTIAVDEDAFLASLVDKDAKGNPITLPDGTTVPRLPGYNRWMWTASSAASSGSLGLAAPKRCRRIASATLGHRSSPGSSGAAARTRALREILPDARAEGLKFVDLITDRSNVASQRVIEANGGVIVEEFVDASIWHRFGEAQGLLLDAHVEGFGGGSGKALDWSLVPGQGSRQSQSVGSFCLVGCMPETSTPGSSSAFTPLGR